MNLYVAAVTGVMVLAACATVHESYEPDGRKPYAVDCSGTSPGWDKCYAAADETCGAAGYDVLDRSSEDVAMGGYAGSTVKTTRTMRIACKVK